MSDLGPDLHRQLVRKFIFDHFVAHAAPPVVEQLMMGFSLPREDATKVLRELEVARPSKQELTDHFAAIGLTGRVLAVVSLEVP